MRLNNHVLYLQERTKALGYITTNKRAAEIAIEATDEVAMKRQQIDNINHMHIKIIRCNGLQSRRKGKTCDKIM